MGREFKLPKGRPQGSKYDAYKDDIKNLSDMGFTLEEICEHLQEVTGETIYVKGLSYYASQNGILPKSMYRKPANCHCSDCPYHKVIKPYQDNIVNDYRLCTKSWRMIRNNIVYIPMWCELHTDKDEYSRNEVLKRSSKSILSHMEKEKGKK